MAKNAIRLPPGPVSPAAWQLACYSLWPLEFLERCARRYGDVFTLRLSGYEHRVMFSSPDAVREIFRADPRVLHGGEANEYLSIATGKTSVLVLDEDLHERQRRVLIAPFKGDRMRTFFHTMQDAARREMVSWRLNAPFTAASAMRRITSQVIFQAVLGWPVSPPLVHAQGLFDRMMSHTRGPLHLFKIKLFGPKRIAPSPKIAFYKALWDFHALVQQAITGSREQAAQFRPPCLLTELLAATHEDGTALNDDEIRDAIVTLLIGGNDSTTIALSWAVNEILQRENVIGDILDELRATTGGDDLTADHLPHLHYLDAVIREVLRLRTAVPNVIRLAKAPLCIDGREYPAGVVLAPCAHLVHRRPDLYPDPEEFRPQRFLDRKFTPSEWFPFGGGNHICLGTAFALFQMKTVLATLLTSCRLIRTSRSNGYVRQGVGLVPKSGCPVVLVERSRFEPTLVTKDRQLVSS